MTGGQSYETLVSKGRFWRLERGRYYRKARVLAVDLLEDGAVNKKRWNQILQIRMRRFRRAIAHELFGDLPWRTAT